MKFFDFILESRLEDFQSKYGRKFSEEQQKKIIDNVPQKYWDWVGKNFDAINFQSNFLDLVNNLRYFDKISSNLPITDINSYKNLEQLVNALQDYAKRARRDYTEMEGGKVVFDDGRFFVVNPQTHDASCHYGKGTKWCTASGSDQQFKQYNEDGKLFYILDRNADSSDPFYKVALLKKFNGDKTFYLANDETTNIFPAHIGQNKYDAIMQKVDEYLKSEYGEQIKFYEDKEKARKEKETQERLRIQRLMNQKREECDERRIENEWALGPDCPEEGLMAHALLKWLDDNGDVDVRTREDEVEINRIKSEIDRLQNEYDNSENVETDLLDEISELEEELQELEKKIDVYNISPVGEYYDMIRFEVIDAELDDREYAVGTEEQVQRSCEEKVEQLIDDIGYEGFNKSFVSHYIDDDAVADWAEDLYSEDVYNNPEIYLDESDRELSSEQEDKISILKYKIEKTEHEIENLEELKDDENGDDINEKIDELRDMISELEDEITDIESEPDGEFPDELIQEKIDELVQDVKRDVESFMQEHGLEYENFIDKERFIEGAIDVDGYGHTLNGYDGTIDEVEVEGQWFHVMRID